MNATDMHRAEHVGKISRDRRETAAIHGEDNHRRGASRADRPWTDFRPRIREIRYRRPQRSQDKETRRRLATISRTSTPKETADHVEYRYHQDIGRGERGRYDQRHRCRISTSWFCHANHADARRDIEASIIHSCQNCGVLSAWSICNIVPVIMPEATGWGQPSGFQSLAGTRYMNAAMTITIK